MPQLKFYDLRSKKAFTTDKYKFETKRTKRGLVHFAVATAPSGVKSWRIVGKEFFNKNK